MKGKVFLGNPSGTKTSHPGFATSAESTRLAIPLSTTLSIQNKKSKTKHFPLAEKKMEAIGVQSLSNGVSLTPRTRKFKSRTGYFATFSPFLVQSMATQQKPISTSTGTVGSNKGSRPRNSNSSGGAPPVKLLTRVEQLRLLTKAEKAGLLSAAENFGFSLSTIERLGLLSKAEGLGVLSAAADPGTPGALFSLSMGLLILGPVSVYLLPEDNLWEVVLQVMAVLVCVVGGSAAFAASNLVSNLQKSN